MGGWGGEQRQGVGELKGAGGDWNPFTNYDSNKIA